VKQLASHGPLLLALPVAWLLKLHYSQADASELRWILAPTTWLTSLALGRTFEFLPGEGYLSRELSILISPACAGVNFLVVAFCTLSLGFGARFGSLRAKLVWLLASLGLAYAATLLVNALRIVISVEVGHLAAHQLRTTFQAVHRLIGVVVYLVGLVGLCLTVQHWLFSRTRARGRAPLVLALGVYAAVTLAVPLLRGAGRNPEYWSHAVPVSVLVVVSGALLFAARGRTWDDGRHALRSPEHSQ
jgi:exosortase K